MKNIIIAAIAAGVLLTACTKSPESAVLGKWKDPQGEIVEFIKGGDCVIRGTLSKYRVVGADKLSIDVPGGGGIVMEFQVKGAQMDLSLSGVPGKMVWVRQ